MKPAQEELRPRGTAVHLTSVHAPTDARIFEKECATLAAAGWRVTLIAPCVHDDRLQVRGVKVVGVPVPRNRWRRLSATVRQVYRAAVREAADVYHFHDPELILAGLLLKLRGKRVIYDVHEDVPRQILSKHWLPRWLRGFIGRTAALVEWGAARTFDGVVAATPTIARRFPKQKTVVVNNYPLADVAAAGAADAPPPAVVAYVGGISRERGICQLLDAMSRLPGSCPARLALAGKFVPADLEAVAKATAGWQRVDFHGWCSRAEVARLLAASQIGIVTLLPAPNYVESQPTKLFEYMSAGLPVVASDFPLWREIVKGNECGLLVDPLDPQAIAEAIGWLLDHPREAEQMGRRGQMAIRERYNWCCEVRVLIEFYERLTHERGHDRRREAAIRESGRREQGASRAA